MIFTLILTYVFGLLTGAVGIVGITLYIGKRALDKKKVAVAVSAAPKAADKKESVSSKMKRVKVITDEQLDLSARADGPQKNGLDGKYKNSLMSHMKSLEEEKNEILKSILRDGLDPELTTMDSSGVITKMKLSEYLAYMGVSMEPKAKSPQEIKTERMGKFTVHRGGKDDGSGSSTTH